MFCLLNYTLKSPVFLSVMLGLGGAQVAWSMDLSFFTQHQDADSQSNYPRRVQEHQAAIDGLTQLKGSSKMLVCPKAFVEALKANHTLVELDLSNCGLGSGAGAQIAGYLLTNRTLKTLNLSNNQISSFLQDGVNLAAVLKYNTTLETLDLSKNGLGTEQGMQIGASLEGNRSLKSLRLGGNKLKFIGAKAIFDGLAFNKALLILDIGENEIINKEWLFLYTDKKDRAQAALSLCKSLGKNETLTSLNVEKNNLGYVGAAAFSGVLMSENKLLLLNIAENNFDYDSIDALAVALEINTTLKGLDLSRNKMSPESIEILGKALMQNRTLTKLNLNKTAFGNEGADFIAIMLMKNNTLESLEIRDNGFDVKGGVMIVCALKSNTILKSLDLGNNKISHKCSLIPGTEETPNSCFGHALADTLRTNWHLQTIVGDIPDSISPEHPLLEFMTLFEFMSGLERNRQFELHGYPKVMLLIMAHNSLEPESTLKELSQDAFRVLILAFIQAFASDY